MNELMLAAQPHVLTVADIRTRINLIQDVMSSIMIENVHYGVIPGCKQPSLYKAGSEVILATFQTCVQIEANDVSDADSITYRVRATGVHIPTGAVIGHGIGQCSSNEEKYKWRRAACIEEFDATPENRRRVKWTAGYGGKSPYKVNQVRVEPADMANTILKMAKKRAQMDLTLTAFAASDIFTQDVEDIPEELRDNGNTNGGVTEHEGMKAAKTVAELVAIINGIPANERIPYLAYFEVRKTELSATK